MNNFWGWRRKQMWALLAQEFASAFASSAVQFAVPQQAFLCNFCGLLCRLPLAVNEHGTSRRSAKRFFVAALHG